MPVICNSFHTLYWSNRGQELFLCFVNETDFYLYTLWVREEVLIYLNGYIFVIRLNCLGDVFFYLWLFLFILRFQFTDSNSYRCNLSDS